MQSILSYLICKSLQFITNFFIIFFINRILFSQYKI